MSSTGAMIGSAFLPNQAVTDFETDYAALKKRTRIAWIIGSVIFLLLFMVCSWLGDFFKIREAMSLQEYTDLSALFLIILATVVAIDRGSEKLRHRIIGLESS